jgi:hypothetical protein
MLKLVVLVVLSVPSILAASIVKEIADTLIVEKDTGKLKQTFQALCEEHGDNDSSWALVDVASQGHPGIVVTCLRAEQDPFPNDGMCVSYLVNNTLWNISYGTRDNSESFAKVITSFKSTDVKPLASIRYCTLWRKDAVNVLERVMAKSPKLITDTLPSWLASHGFDRNSYAYKYNQTAGQGGFQYLISFATESVLEKALSIVKANEHCKVDYGDGPVVLCCKSQDDFPQDLVDRLNILMELMKARNALVRRALSFMPAVLLNLLAEYTTYEAIDYSILGRTKCLIL